VPSKSSPDLFQPHVAAANPHHANSTSVPVSLVPFNGHLFPKQHLRERLPGPVPEGLSLLRRVYSGEPDLVLSVRSVKNRNRVAVRKPDDFAVQRFSASGLTRGEADHQENARRSASAGVPSAAVRRPFACSGCQLSPRLHLVEVVLYHQARTVGKHRVWDGATELDIVSAFAVVAPAPVKDCLDNLTKVGVGLSWTAGSRRSEPVADYCQVPCLALFVVSHVQRMPLRELTSLLHDGGAGTNGVYPRVSAARMLPE